MRLCPESSNNISNEKESNREGKVGFDIVAHIHTMLLVTSLNKRAATIEPRS